MMKSLLRIATATTFLAAVASADDFPGSAGIGAAKPIGDLGKGSNFGFVVNVGYNFMIFSGLGLRPEVTINLFEIKSSAGGGAASEMGFMGNVVYYPPIPAAVMNPYAIAGIGYIGGTRNVGNSPNSNALGYGLGGGVEFAPLGKYQFFLEIRYMSSSHSYPGYNSTSMWVPLTLGMRFGL